LWRRRRIRFRYTLEGQDPDWKETTDRRASKGNLRPRNYRFRVQASNNSGVWNEAGASLDFSVAPAYYQAAWFGALCGVAFWRSSQRPTNYGCAT